jgi:alanine dehydrogenase
LLLINEEEVRQLLPMNECVEVIDKLFRDAAEGTVSNMPRYRIPLPHGALQVMAGMSESLGVTGLKTYATGSKGGGQMVVLLISLEDGQPFAFLTANALGQIRTGAASGVATRYMARGDATSVGMIGSGFQARSQLAAVCAVRPVNKVKVYSRTPENRERFAHEMSEKLGITATAVETADHAADADIVCVITNSREPVLKGDALRPGTHVNAAGSNGWIRHEVDEETVRRSALVVSDDIADAKIESGDLIWAAERRKFRWETAVELKDVVSGRVSGRPSADAITLFESQGLAIEDVAAGMHIYRKAIEQGLGRQVEI